MTPQQETQIVWQGNYLRMIKRGKWEFVQRTNNSGIVGIVAVTSDDKIVLVQQHRPPSDCDVIEIPAGLAGDIPGHEEEAFVIAAKRELLVEAGYEAQNWEALFTGASSAGLSDETLTVFKATQLTKVAPGGGDDSENITVHEVPLTEVDQWLGDKQSQGILVDIKLQCLLHEIKRE